MSRRKRTEPTPGWEQALAEADVTLWLSDTVPMPFRRIPAGEFRMGSRGEDPDEEPRHLVRITRPFYMATFPTTQHQYRTVVGRKKKDGLEPSPSDFKGDLRPVENVSWHDAVQWCGLLQNKPLLQDAEERLGGGELNVGLPSEAQWEYACRASTDTEYYTGDGEAALQDAGWYGGNSGEETHDVGLKLANRFRLYDMHGNVDEWCADAFDEHAYRKRVNGVCDPFIDGASDANRVLRGGGWFGSPGDCRSAYRDCRRPVIRYRSQSFRVCLFLGPCPGQAGRAEQASAGMATRDEAATP
jgi:formylglycine-generating enzyme required for sulfatase activity